VMIWSRKDEVFIEEKRSIFLQFFLQKCHQTHHIPVGGYLQKKLQNPLAPNGYNSRWVCPGQATPGTQRPYSRWEFSGQTRAWHGSGEPWPPLADPGPAQGLAWPGSYPSRARAGCRPDPLDTTPASPGYFLLK